MTEIDQIKERIRIKDLCDKYGIRLFKSGKNWKGLCPFHNEKTPSFHINDSENFFKCFGCQEGGDVIKFYGLYHRVEAGDAIRELKSLAGIDGSLPNIERKRKNEAASASFPAVQKETMQCMSEDERYVYEERLGISGEESAALSAVRNMRLEKNKEVFFELWFYCLTHWCDDKTFRNYLEKERRLSPLIIEKKDLFYIGNYNQVNNHLKKKFKIEDLQRSGLFNENGNMIFYSHKIIIPYKWKNEIIYLRGRCIEQNEGYSKYLGLRNDGLNLNTPKRFYNVDVIESLLPGEHLYITEGEFDAIMMEDLQYNSVGIPGVGNLPSSNWLRKLLGFKIILIPDKDAAGEQLRNALSEIFLNMGKDIYTKKIRAKDPTELVRESGLV